MADCSLPIPIDAGNGTCDIALDPLPAYEPFTLEQLRSGAVAIKSDLAKSSCEKSHRCEELTAAPQWRAAAYATA